MDFLSKFFKKIPSAGIMFFLVILLYFGYLSFVPIYIKTLVVSAILLFWPGQYLLKLFFLNSSEKIDLLQFIAYSFCFGVAFWSVIGFAYFYFNLSLDFIIFISLFFIFLGGIFANIFIKNKSIPGKSLILEKNPLSYDFIFLYFLIFLFSFLTFLSAPYQKVEFDIFYHLAGIEKILAGEKYLAADFFLGSAAKELFPYAANSWYFILAIFAKISHVNPGEINIIMSTIVSAASVFLFYSLSRLILKKPSLAVISSSLYIIYITIIYTGIISKFFETMYTAFLAHPGEALRFTIFPVLTIFLVKYVLSGKRTYFFSSLFLMIPLATIHIQFYLYLAITLFSLFLAALFIREKSIYVENYTEKNN